LERDARVERRRIAAAEIGGMNDVVNAAGDLRTLPCHLAELGGMDGFYAARLVRRT
jgi:16S rRNA (cytosine967-C5)-methyltransferase